MQSNTTGPERWLTPAQVPLEVTVSDLAFQLRWPRPRSTPIAVDPGFPVASQGEGPPLLFVHGLGHDLSDWRLVFEPPRYSAWALDLPGFGMASLEDVSLDALVRAVTLTAKQALETTGRPPLLVGSSLGGHVGMLAALAGAPLSGLFLLAPGGLFPVPEAARREALELYSEERLVARPEEEVLAGARRLVAGTHPEGERVAARKLALHRSSRVGEYMEPFARIVEEVLERPVGPELASIQQPLHFVIGAEDLVVPPVTVHTAAALQGLPVTELDGVGHLPMLEAPDRLLELLLPFARSCFGRPA